MGGTLPLDLHSFCRLIPFFSVLACRQRGKNDHWILSLHWRYLCFMDCWKWLIKRCRIKLTIFFCQNFLEKKPTYWKRWLVCVKLVVKLLCYGWHLLTLNGTREFRSVVFSPSSTLHIFLSTLFISEREATGDFLKGKHPTQTSVPIHVKWDSYPEMYMKIT